MTNSIYECICAYQILYSPDTSSDLADSSYSIEKYSETVRFSILASLCLIPSCRM